MNKKLRGAVVGVGYLGQFHAQKYANCPDVELIGVCDAFPEQADKIAANMEVQSFHKPQELIGKVDVVTIAASTLSHFELAELFLKNGIHVNVEKPITATVPQAEILVKLAKENNLKLAVGHIERFNPSVIEIKKNIKGLKFLELTRMAPYKERGADVSVLHDLMIHDIDMLYNLTGSAIKSMTASGSKLISPELDVASVSMVMESGVHALINVSRIATNTVRSVRVVQEGSTLFANTGTHELEKVEKGTAEEPIRITKWTLEKADALQAETDAFIKAVLNNEEPVVTGVDGLRALKTIEEIEKLIGK